MEQVFSGQQLPISLPMHLAVVTCSDARVQILHLGYDASLKRLVSRLLEQLN